MRQFGQIHFVFPRDYDQPDCPEETFADQWAALTQAGFSVSLCSDAVFNGTKALRNVPSGCRVVYRGWMVNRNEYAAFVAAINRAGATAFTNHQEYLTAHYLPIWYPLLSDLTPETRFYTEEANIVEELRRLGWGRYFLKDYVKSLKTGRGPIVEDPLDAPDLIAEMREYRGEIEGGICVRRVEDIMPESEQRYFLLNGVALAPDEGAPIPDLVHQCAERIPSKFFSVDVAKRRDGALRVVEIGDGQVSDVVGWSADAFAAMWLRDALTIDRTTTRGGAP